MKISSLSSGMPDDACIWAEREPSRGNRDFLSTTCGTGRESHPRSRRHPSGNGTGGPRSGGRPEVDDEAPVRLFRSTADFLRPDHLPVRPAGRGYPCGTLQGIFQGLPPPRKFARILRIRTGDQHSLALLLDHGEADPSQHLRHPGPGFPPAAQHPPRLRHRLVRPPPAPARDR